jgi:hypothetical protein
MERTLIEAWEAIEAQERLDEKKRLGKVTAVKSPKAKVTAVKTKKLDEDGVGGANGAGVGSGSYDNQSGNTMTKSGNAAVVPKKLGMKEDIKSDATNVAKQAVNNVKSGKGTGSDATVVGSIVSEEEAPDLSDLDVPGADGGDGEAAPEADGDEVSAGDETAAVPGDDSVEMDAETAQEVISAIKTQYPNAIVTIAIQLPEEDAFDSDVVAAAQEVVGAADDAGAAAVEDPTAAIEDPAAEEAPAEDGEELLERKQIISKTRKQIKEMFARMSEEGEEPVADPAADPVAGAEEVPAVDPVADPAAIDPTAGAGVEPEIEVGDTKISLTPEQWGQVLATTNLLNAGAGEAPAGEEIPAAGEEPAGEEVPAEGGEEGTDELDELRTEVNLSGDGAKMEIKKKIEQGDFKNDKNTGEVSIKKPEKKVAESKKKEKVEETFNNELAGYASALQKMLGE